MVTGPSGAGKDSVIAEARNCGLVFGTVTTTSSRPMRFNEHDGQPYHFVTHEQFEEMIAQGQMIEWAKVYGNLYGSTREEVEYALNKNDVVMIKVDPQGARQFKELFSDCTTIFIAPPSLDYLQRRLEHRDADAPDVIVKRLAIAREELENIKQWDVVIRNEEGKLTEAARDLMTVVYSH